MNLPKFLKKEIVDSLKPLAPEKIILFGSYAWGEPNEESDIDLFIVKNIAETDVRRTILEARRSLRDIIMRRHIGIDILSDSPDRIAYRIEKIRDQFYAEIMEKGVVLYGQ